MGRGTRVLSVMVAALGLALFGACGNDDGGSALPTEGADDDSGDADGDTDDVSPTGGGGGGSLTLDGEEIGFDNARCFLEEQESAGQQILLTAQAFGTDAAGEEVMIDFTRWGEESDFTGDDVSITIGDPFAEDARSLGGRVDIGGVSVDGSTVSATDMELTGEGGATVAADFVIEC